MDAMDWYASIGVSVCIGMIGLTTYEQIKDNAAARKYNETITQNSQNYIAELNVDKAREAHRASECNEKEGTYLPGERVCLDLSSIRLGQDTSSVSVVIYGAPWCEPCSDAIAYLDRRHIQYIEKNVDDRETMIEMNSILDQAQEKHGLIPVIVVSKKDTHGAGAIVRGWNQSDVSHAIEKFSTYSE